MNVVVAGLSPRDEAAFAFFMNRTMKGWSWKSTPAGRGAVLPAADLLVADLVSLGLAHWSEAAEADLLRLLHGTPAVLLVPSNDRTWAEMDAGTVKRHSLVWLAKPYGAEAMRVALEEAAASSTAIAVPLEGPATARLNTSGQPLAVEPVLPRHPPDDAPAALREVRLPIRSPMPLVSTPTPTAPLAVSRTPAASGMGDDIPQLSAAALQARLAVLPQDGRHVFLRKLSEMLAQKVPFEARFTVQNSVIFHPADGWVASNTPTLVIERVCQSDALASAVNVREIDGLQAEERAHRLGMPLRELDAFLWGLAFATLDKKPANPRV